MVVISKSMLSIYCNTFLSMSSRYRVRPLYPSISCSVSSSRSYSITVFKHPSNHHNHILYKDLYNNNQSTNQRTILRTITTQNKSWIDSNKLIPSSLKPYLHLIRADKQIGTMLLLWPCWWSISLAAPLGQLPDPVILIKFSIGALLMRSAGCIINDIWDRDFDRQVERTKNRPLASGELTVMDAGVTLFFTLSASFAILLSFNYNSIFLGLASMPIVIGYPLMKRYTYFPQAILGLAMNWGALLGWNEVIGTCSLVPVLPLYLGGVFWTLVYDTIYGYQDVSDDAKLGLKSTSLYLGDNPQFILSLWATSSISCLLFAGYNCHLTLPFYTAMLITCSHFVWQINTLDIKDKSNLWQRFISNQYVGGVITIGIIAGHF